MVCVSILKTSKVTAKVYFVKICSYEYMIIIPLLYAIQKSINTKLADNDFLNFSN